MSSYKEIKIIKRDRAIRRFKNSEILATILSGLSILLLVSPFLIFYIVSSKNSLDIAYVSEDTVDTSYVVISDETGNVLDTNDYHEKLEQSGIYTIPKEVEFSKDSLNFYSFCSEFDSNIKTIVVYAFDYLLPFISYNCAKNDVIVYGVGIESEQGLNPSLITKITWSFNSFF